MLKRSIRVKDISCTKTMSTKSIIYLSINLFSLVTKQQNKFASKETTKQHNNTHTTQISNFPKTTANSDIVLKKRVINQRSANITQSAFLYRPAGGISAILTVSGPPLARCRSKIKKNVIIRTYYFLSITSFDC